jgi:bifunctional N-acetylglucosamine-1-phosphate-uridyltransferase/glucosamine-1-phosphate-acetyltransferase GlmU-like protein
MGPNLQDDADVPLIYRESLKKKLETEKNRNGAALLKFTALVPRNKHRIGFKTPGVLTRWLQEATARWGFEVDSGR